jgi:hypothetical protein
MIRPILIFFLLLTQFHANAQFSASAGYRYSLDGVDFQQNHLNFYAHWKQARRFHFSAGLEFTPNRMDYVSIEERSDYSHGSPGEYMSKSDIYDRTAKVSYVFLSGGLFFDWAMIEAKNFDLLIGFYGQAGGTIFKNEKDHVTNGRHSFSSSIMGVESSGSTIDPTSYSEFEAIEMVVVNANIGLKLSPRWYFNQNYAQLDLSVGRTAQRIFRDLKGADCYDTNNCFNYSYLFRNDKPFYASFGLTVGHNF